MVVLYWRAMFRRVFSFNKTISHTRHALVCRCASRSDMIIVIVLHCINQWTLDARRQNIAPECRSSRLRATSSSKCQCCCVFSRHSSVNSTRLPSKQSFRLAQQKRPVNLLGSVTHHAAQEFAGISTNSVNLHNQQMANHNGSPGNINQHRIGCEPSAGSFLLHISAQLRQHTIRSSKRKAMWNACRSGSLRIDLLNECPPLSIVILRANINWRTA